MGTGKCSKCNGTMVIECFHDIEATQNFDHFNGWRCINCGKMVDRVILDNAKKKPIVHQEFLHQNRKKRRSRIKPYIRSKYATIN